MQLFRGLAMKALLITFVVVAAGVFALAQFGGFLSFDPEAEAAELKPRLMSAAEQSMTWQALCDEVRAPRKYQAIRPPTSLGSDRTGELQFERETFEQQFNTQYYDMGFIFLYRLGGDTIEVHFDASGTAVETYDIPKLDPLNPMG